ncbi:DUF294 nucleotidyltransferase-like domain-containing protein [Psychrobacter sp. I-STPA10]|uniref:DUF294 nucleotidyltransferase-like domain-containing protein n=1 Tax=Psychrobacter sp. I-STPA10 TaxID=2585769 RepID=UPI001E59C178|nr:DUF294 nucleotidyltransferase-like domain-containing protein [Psychrobacter sp. I-STPA10]
MTQLDFSQPPFDVLTPTERQSLKKHTQVRYLGKNDSLTDKELDYFYVVLKGRIQQKLNDDYVGDFTANEYSNDWFDARRQFNTYSSEHNHNTASANTTISEPTNDNNTNKNAPKSSSYCYQALEDTLLLQVEAAAIDRLSAQNHLVRQLLSGELSERMQALNMRKNRQKTSHQIQATSQKNNPTQNSTTHANHNSNQAEAQQLMLQPVTSITLLPVKIINEAASLFEAAQIMTNTGLKHVLIQRTPSPERHPTRAYDSNFGILTDTDICRAISESAEPKSTPCHTYANFKLRTISEHDDVSDALLTMIRYQVHRLPVVNATGEIIGILGQSNLLAYISHHSQLISVQIQQAQDIQTLASAVDQIGQYIRAQQHDGIKVGVISRMVQTLNAQVFTKLWQLIVPDMVFENTCVIVMGSEGRGEQIMRTDQDNALIIRNGFNHPELPEYAEQFNQHLADMGYPLCDGNIMMSNPLWRLPLNRFKTQISQWFKAKEPNHSIWLAALLDAAYVCGDERLLDSLRQHLAIAYKQADPMFVRGFARAALQFGDVNQWWKSFAPLIGKPAVQDVDLKKAGIFPLVHGIRAMALEQQIFAVTNTKARLQALTRCGVLTSKRAETLNETLEFFIGQRLAVALSSHDKNAHQVDPTTLSALERDLLKECLAVVKSFKNQLRQHYQLEIN